MNQQIDCEYSVAKYNNVIYRVIVNNHFIFIFTFQTNIKPI